LSGLKILAHHLEKQGLLPHLEAEGDLTPLLKSAAKRLIQDLEKEMELPTDQEEELFQRVRSLRRKIHQSRLHTDENMDFTRVMDWNERVMLAFRILQYVGSYLEEKPTLDRFAETTERLLEDLSRDMLPPIGPRQVFVRLGTPQALSNWMADYRKQSRDTIQRLTRCLEDEVQSGLDQICADNSFPGGKFFMEGQ
jgi:hypothetical protein